RISVAGVGGSGLTMRQREHRLDHSASSFRALFMISKPRQRLLLRSESPLSDMAARCANKRRSWVSGSQTGEAGRGAACSRDAERSNAVDGVRRQFSGARSDMELCRAQLPQIRCRSVLDGLGVRGRALRGAGEFAIRVRVDTDAAVRRLLN